MSKADLIRGDEFEREMFRNYSVALKMWSRRFNTAEIAARLKQEEHVVLRWIHHWRELSREGLA